MATNLKTYELQQFLTMDGNGTLEISPDIQRRAVWKPISKMLLIDSVARGVPIGAITLYENSEDGYSKFEVIDGKQRLSTILEFANDGFAVDRSKVDSTEDDEIAEVGREQVEPIYEKRFSELAVPERMKLLQYSIPVFVVTGSRAQAVQAFTRMNKNSYVLKPQEIRNAVYSKSFFLRQCFEISTEFVVPAAPEIPGFQQMRIISEDGIARMQDIQFAAELLALVLEGEQPRRDTLNDFHEKYRSDSGAAAEKCRKAASSVLKALGQLAEIFDDGAPLGTYHFPQFCENDVYALVGALCSRGLFAGPVLQKFKTDLREGISEFRRQVKLYIEAARDAEVPDDAPLIVARYAQTFLGGQQNSTLRRAARREAISELLDGIADPPADAGFSQATRELIWASSTDKICGRCGEVVPYEEYHAGHVVPRASGGLPTLANGRIEHRKCNQSAGADLG